MLNYQMLMSLRLLLATVLGGIIGLERESLNKSAGLRTHILVCLGSCLIMITSIEMTAKSGGTADPARLAAQVVSGIGFLGAGTIIRSGFSIRGLTTAASLWAVAGVGLAVGSGSYYTALVTTVIVYLVLVYMTKVQSKIRFSKNKYRQIKFYIEDKLGKLSHISSILSELEIDIRNVEVSDADNSESLKLVYTVVTPYHLTEADIIDSLRKVPGIRDISVASGGVF